MRESYRSIGPESRSDCIFMRYIRLTMDLVGQLYVLNERNKVNY